MLSILLSLHIHSLLNFLPQPRPSKYPSIIYTVIFKHYHNKYDITHWLIVTVFPYSFTLLSDNHHNKLSHSNQGTVVVYVIQPPARSLLYISVNFWLGQV